MQSLWRVLIINMICWVVLCSNNASALCVVKQKARLRSGPGANFSVSWTVGQYMPLRMLREKSGWFEVSDQDGAKYWVAKADVSEKIQCVAVKSKFVRLRSGPGPQYPVSDLATAHRYTPFRKTDREGEWIQVEDEYHVSYWVNDRSMWWPISRVSVTF